MMLTHRGFVAALIVRRSYGFVQERKELFLTRRQLRRNVCGMTWKTEKLPYAGILATIESDKNNNFYAELNESIETKWKDKYLSAWLRIPLAQAGLAAEASRLGFRMHHAPADGETLILYKWLSNDSEDKVPYYAPATQIGCAGFLVNKNREILVIKEWRIRSDGSRVPAHMWKLPGGLADPGENILQAAARETFEETGIKSHGISVLAFWHRHNVTPWEKSDLYFIVRLECIAAENQIQLCPSEIAAARWVKIDNYFNSNDEEFKHPLIRKICRELYTSTEPTSEMIDLGIQFPGRDLYPTYFPQHLTKLTQKILAVASDVDGTLLMKNAQLHPQNKIAILNTNIKFFPATGKCRAGARNSLDGIPITAGVFVNGLVVYDDNDSIIFERTLSKETVQIVQSICKGHEASNFFLVAYCRDCLFSPTPEASRVAELATFYKEPKPIMWPSNSQTISPNKLLILGEPQSLLDARPRIEQSLESYASITSAMSNMLEVLPLGASKRLGVQALCNHLGICEHTQLLAIGDGENDIDMLRHAAIGVALENASPSVKRAADIIVNDNDSAGAARALGIASALSSL